MAAETHQGLLDKLRPQLLRLPIFPLHKVQLFPYSMLPLYVFEQRYRDLMEASLAQGGGLAVASLCPGFEADYEGRPPVRPIAGAGQVLAHRQNPDGTYNILLHGVGRIRIEEELPPLHAYREVRATLLCDHVPPAYDMAGAQEALILLVDQLSRQLSRHNPEGADTLRSLCRCASGPGELSDVLAAALLPSPALRQQVLETTDVSERMEQVTAEIARLAAESEGNRAGAN